MSEGSLVSAAPSRGIRTGALGLLAAALLVAALTLLAAVAGLGAAGLIGGEDDGARARGSTPSALAQREIPPQYLRLYERAADRYGLDWAVLAAIGKVECDHGRDADPSCSRAGAVNAAGAGGPMQFLASTWSQYGVDGDGDGRASRWDAADAIFAAANYLSHSGAPGDYERAIFAYNHASWYVADVQAWASRYRGSTLSSVTGGTLLDGESGGDGESAGSSEAVARLQAGTLTPVRTVAGDRAVLAPGDGHVALVPSEAPLVVKAMIVAGNELQSLPYGPGGHPDPRGALEEDCSSTVNYVLYRAGVRPIDEIVRDNPLAQDYVHWGLPGPGRWVTIYATTSPTDHVFIAIAGIRLDTSHNGTDVGPNRDEDGPRWRLLDHIPTWAHWSVRHPPGL
jgi:hypothetical protein